jgi:antirestriction protein
MIDFDPQECAFFEYIKEDIPDLDEKLFEEIDSEGIETVEQFEDAYAGKFESEADFAEQLCSDCGYLEESNLPNFIANHIDWQAVWDRELTHDYTFIEHNNQIYFFSRHF